MKIKEQRMIAVGGRRNLKKWRVLESEAEQISRGNFKGASGKWYFGTWMSSHHCISEPYLTLSEAPSLILVCFWTKSPDKEIKNQNLNSHCL